MTKHMTSCHDMLMHDVYTLYVIHWNPKCKYIRYVYIDQSKCLRGTTQLSSSIFQKGPRSSWSQLLLQFLFGERTKNIVVNGKSLRNVCKRWMFSIPVLTEVRVVKRLPCPMVTSEISCWRMAFLRFAAMKRSFSAKKMVGCRKMGSKHWESRLLNKSSLIYIVHLCDRST